jgi:quercetin dioxygenase-like cupin family protein
MELSERCIQTLEKEGFRHIFEWHDEPNTVYEPHAHKGKVTLFLTDGSLTFDFLGKKKELVAPARFDVPVGETHAAIVGPKGAYYVVGEEIEGDS